MNVLVAYSSKHGSTKEIAERIALDLTQDGASAEARPVTADVDLGLYDAFLIGSAVYYGRWMGEASGFVRRNASVLRERPVWLFSSGPIGDRVKDGRDQRETAVPTDVAELTPLVAARGSRVFFGKVDRADLHGLDAVVGNLMKLQGDYRDWDDVDAWARDIALELRAIPQPVSAV